MITPTSLHLLCRASKGVTWNVQTCLADEMLKKLTCSWECNPPPQNKTAVKQTLRERETLPCAIA